ncbi:MAG: hypothetical protein ISR58_18915 [Anaerolineales bacterium]|nr:hypothetical protein [Chloroflexota bacterium]MBL6983254.1 hypothetical protein [Anaerolineales bacterium]
MTDKLKTVLAIIILFLSLITPVTGLLYGLGRWDALTILLVMGGIFVAFFAGGVLVLATVKDFTWMTASLPFLFSSFYTILPDFPGPIDDAAVTSAGALITYFFALRRNEGTPKWIIIPLLLAGAYTLLGGSFFPGPIDEVVVDVIALLIASYGARTAEKQAQLAESAGESEHAPPFVEE